MRRLMQEADSGESSIRPALAVNPERVVLAAGVATASAEIPLEIAASPRRGAGVLNRFRSRWRSFAR